MNEEEESSYRFSWSLVLAGSVVAVAVTFLLLLLGSGVGLQFVKPDATQFFTGGAIYFLAAQAFGFAAGGHVTGRLLGPLPKETQYQEEVRAAIHGLTAWAVAVLATIVLVGFAGAATAALYGVSRTSAGPSHVAPLTVDRLFRPGPSPTIAAPGVNPVTQPPSAQPSPPPATPAETPDPVHARAEAGRLIEADFALGSRFDAEDRARLVQLTAEQAHVPVSEARLRVAATESRLNQESQQAAQALHRATSTAALWLACALLFGALAAMVAAITARLEDDHQTAWSLFALHRGWRS